MKKELKKVSAFDDYTLNQMMSLLRGQIFAITSYFQNNYKYDDEYNKAFDLYKAMLKAADKWEDALASLNRKEK